MNSQRIRALMRKETLQILRDPSSIAIAFVMPLFLLLLFGYGVSLDARHVPIALVASHQTRQTSAFFADFQSSAYFHPRFYPDMPSARRALMHRDVDGIVWLRSDFSRGTLEGAATPVSVIVNGVNANNARILEGYVQGVWANWLAVQAQKRGDALVVPVDVRSRVWFNPALRSHDYLVPGLIALIMTLIGALLTALVVAREWERGTMEALMASPVTMAEILVGKLVPYFGLGMGGMALTLVLAVGLFSVPLVGSLWVLALCSALFLMTALGMGLLISTVAKNQFVAGMIALVATYLPAFILSGFIFDIHSMPWPIRLITHLIAARYFVSILQTLFLAGDVWPVIIRNSAALIAIAAIFLGIVARISRKRLD
ncbi:ABC transporter permease [Acidiferrobacter sp.]|uniref:ABC transporter permease n=1 Tax=Acidiferrobacter sp. TaxID=1872107 RepID=UPI002620E5F6|nr:ABC transporter permease [Acidiferrobacter sp.]